MPSQQDSLYGEECVFVANDWHAALLPVLLAAKYRTHGVYKAARSILAIHNLRHQVGILKGTLGSNPGLNTSNCWQGSSSVRGIAPGERQAWEGSSASA